MSSFDKRGESFEGKFAHDAALQFKALARRNKKLGLWAAEKLGKSGPEAEAYAKAIVSADLEEAGVAQVNRTPQSRFDDVDGALGHILAASILNVPSALVISALMVPLAEVDVKPAVPRVVAVASCWMAKLPVPFRAMLRPPRIWLATGVTKSVPASTS